MMALSDYFPFWDALSVSQQEWLEQAAVRRTVAKGTLLHNGSEDCVGLLLVTEGQLRVFARSDSGREITLYRLLDRDLCLLSASCILRGVDFDVAVEAERETSFYQIPAPLYQQLMDQSAAVANYTSEIMAARFSDVMWLMDQVLFKRLDSRLAAFLLEERALEYTDRIVATHEEIARQLGSAREVVTRMLRYFQSEGLVVLSRGAVSLSDVPGLERLARESLR